MSGYAWATMWWIGVGVALGIATHGSEGWRKWWVRVAALLVSLTTLDRFGPEPPAMSQLLASAPAWMQVATASLGSGCESVGTVAQLACKEAVSGAPQSAASASRP